MSEVLTWSRSRTSPPDTYVEFIEGARRYAESKGVAWDIPYDEYGDPEAEADWDLRLLTDSHEKHAVNLGSFAIDEPIRAAALAAGWNPASLPAGKVLDAEARTFIKALVAYRCKEARVPRNTRHLARIYKVFFSVIGKAPWELDTEDLDRYAELGHREVKVFDAMKGVARVINVHLLSLACPVTPAERRPKQWQQLQTSLDGRENPERLPDKEALYELARIVFRENPVTHQDLVRFCAIRVILLTGLRLNEVLMLPVDCLRWDDHVDVVTGLSADQVGGVARTLRLRYFAGKQEGGAPDLLVEEHQWVPTRFQEIVAAAIEQAQAATVGLRRVLAAHHKAATVHQDSDLRRFKTSAGRTLTTADLLFLQPVDERPSPGVVPTGTAVTTLNQNAMYLAMGLTQSKWSSSFFARYREAAGGKQHSVRPHALRHLLNTELFRLGVPDTVITQQFGRQTVVQSYEYDHRTLSERLDFIRLPDSAKDLVKPGSSQELVAKMVVGGLVPTSHIAKSFTAIQAASGDLAAFRYLVANSDGFHVTPYGFCLNSFSMNPCARHLKCFDRCKHFTASGLPEHKITLENLRSQLVQMRGAATAKPAKTVGRRNQIAHADALLAGVEAALLAQPNTPVFGGNTDHSGTEKDVLS